jgi:uncharacterized membrane protein YfcA
MEVADPALGLLVLVVIAASFVLSAAAGLGGSLLLVPVLAAVLGVKEGVALAGLLLAANNVVKIVAYRTTIPYGRAAPVVVVSAIGALFGARLLVALPEALVAASVVFSLAWTFLMERRRRLLAAAPPVLGFLAGCLSGFSGTSGPLKGVALRSLGLDRMHLVGAASLTSLVGDATKSAVFADAGLLGTEAVVLAVGSIPMMLLGTFIGRRWNGSMGEAGYAALFWIVMTCYGLRVLI